MAVESDIFAFSFALLRNENDARDITQDVLIKLWQNKQLRNLQDARHWVVRVARNACLDSIKHNSVRLKYQEQLKVVDREETTPLTITKRNQDKETVLDAIRSLQEPQRSIVVLRDLQQYSYKEIADALELSDQQVKVYLHRARKKLHELLLGVTNYEQS